MKHPPPTPPWRSTPAPCPKHKPASCAASSAAGSAGLSLTPGQLAAPCADQQLLGFLEGRAPVAVAGLDPDLQGCRPGRRS